MIYKRLLLFIISFLVLLLFLFIFELGISTIGNMNNEEQSSGKNEVTFFVVGGSTAYGVPIDEHSNFSKFIYNYLDGFYQGKKINLVMIAEPGSNLAKNIIKFLKYTLFSRPKHGVVLVYTGINDWISGKEKKRPGWFEEILSHSLLGNHILYYFYPDSDVNNNNSYDYFYFRLKTLFSWSHKYKYPVYVSSLAGNFHDFPVGSHLNRTSEEIFLIRNCFDLISQLDQIECFSNLGKIGDDYNFYVDYLKYKINNSAENLEQLDQHYRTYDVYRDSTNYRPMPQKNLVIKKISIEMEGVTYIPFYERLKKLDNGFIGQDLFYDAHHPRLKTTKILADSFIKKMIPSQGVEKKIDKNKVILPLNQQAIKNICLKNARWYIYAMLKQRYPFILAKHILSFLNSDCKFLVEEVSTLKSLIYPIAPLRELIVDEIVLSKDVISFLLNSKKVKFRYKQHLDRSYKNSLLTEKKYHRYQEVLGL